LLLSIAYGTSAAANLLLSIALGRRFGAGALGVYAIAVAVARVFYATTELGMGAHLTRSVARDSQGANQRFGVFFAFRAFSIPFGALATVAIVVATSDRGYVLAAFVACALGFVSLQSLCESIFLAREDQRTAALLTLCSSGLVGLSASLWFVSPFELTEFGIAYGAAALSGLAIWLHRLRRSLGYRPAWCLSWKRLREETAASWRIGASILLGIAALKTSVLVLGGFRSPKQVGAFAAVDMFVTATTILQSAVTGVAYPKLARSFDRDPKRFTKVLWQSNAALAVAGLFFALALSTVGSQIAAMLFPSRDFARIAELMPIMGWSAPALMLAQHNIFAFAAANRERANLLLMLGWFLAILGFQLVLVPRYGLLGAAWGLLLSRLFAMGMLFAVVLLTGMHKGRQS